MATSKRRNFAYFVFSTSPRNKEKTQNCVFFLSFRLRRDKKKWHNSATIVKYCTFNMLHRDKKQIQETHCNYYFRITLVSQTHLPYSKKPSHSCRHGSMGQWVMCAFWVACKSTSSKFGIIKSICCYKDQCKEFANWFRHILRLLFVKKQQADALNWIIKCALTGRRRPQNTQILLMRDSVIWLRISAVDSVFGK